MSGRDLDRIVAGLTLDEKAGLTAGDDLWSTVAIPRAGIPKVRVTDGPNGARGPALAGERPSSTSVCIPCGSALGATWNPELIEQVGAMLGKEARTKTCRVLLAPTVNIHRSPLAGRNFECYSEDPLLSGRLAAAFVRGVQAQGVVTTVKHFAGNDAEFERTTINSVIDPRALREIYLLPFELAVREGGALGIMTAYNRLNGHHCAEHAELLAILRDDWGFQGFVLTDWFALGSTVGAAYAGLDLEMPGPGRFYGPALAGAVRNGDVDEAVVDRAARRLLGVFDRVGALDDRPDVEERSVDRPEHRRLARQAATESMVLLANDGLLPLAAGSLSSLAVIGPNADRAQIMGGGSAAVIPHYLVTPLQALRDRLGERLDVRYERGCSSNPAAASRPDLLEQAEAAARAADAAVVIVGTNHHWESEGLDRPSMDLPGEQDELVGRVLAANPNTVVVLNAGAPVTLGWADRARAVLQMWFGGQEMAEALVDVLFGVTDPGGRLPTTFPLRVEHNPSYGNFPGENGQVRYGEGVLVGYRWYEARHLPVRFPFGHGLSYTTFSLGDPRLSSTEFSPGRPLTVEVPVTNSGDRRGTEVVQCYVAPPAPRVLRPPKELKAFAKVALEPGQTTSVRLVLADRSFAYWDPGDPDWEEMGRRRQGVPFPVPSGERRRAGWYIDPGSYDLHIGRSSADVAHVLAVSVVEGGRTESDRPR